MKLYLVRPNVPANSDREATNARLRSCIQPIADLIASRVEADPGLYGIWHEDDVTKPAMKPDASFGSARVALLSGPSNTLRAALTESGNPFGGSSMLVRSLVTCRSVNYGYDGQAFVCLTTSDDPLISPDNNLILVEECSHLLATTDWMDGLDLD